MVVRTGQVAERLIAIALSTSLGGLPLAHEQAASYCERLAVPLATYRDRFNASPITIMSDPRDAPRAYRNRLTAARTFLLAIDEAKKTHSAAGALIIYAALLAPEPIPLYLFSEGREKFSEPFASQIKDDGLDEAVAALRVFALVDRETIPDQRDPTITTDCIRLHRLVRQVAISLAAPETFDDLRRRLIEALAAIYPPNIYDEHETWPRARRVDALAEELVDGRRELPKGAERPAIFLLNRIASYRQRFLAAYAEARVLFERALEICKSSPGLDHDTATNLNDLALLLRLEGNFARAQSLFERAEVIWVNVFGLDHPGTAQHFYNVSALLSAQGSHQKALGYSEQALGIFEKKPDRQAHAKTLNQLGSVHMDLGNLEVGRSYCEEALAIFKEAIGLEHPNTAMNLNTLGKIMRKQGDIEGARGHIETALAICRKKLASEHPDTATVLSNLADLSREQGKLLVGQQYAQEALAIRENVLGPDHPDTAISLNILGIILFDQCEYTEARSSYDRALAIREKVFGLDHPDTKIVVEHILALFDHLAPHRRSRRSPPKIRPR